MTTAANREPGVIGFVKRWPATTKWLAAIFTVQIVSLAYDVVTHS